MKALTFLILALISISSHARNTTLPSQHQFNVAVFSSHFSQEHFEAEGTRPFSIYGIDDGNWTVKNNEKSCPELEEELTTAMGQKILDQNGKDNKLEYVFFLNCEDRIPGEKTVYVSAWVAAFDSDKDKVLRDLYDNKRIVFENFSFILERPVKTMLRLNISLFYATSQKYLSSGGYPDYMPGFQMTLNIPFHQYSNELDKMMALVDVADPLLRREKMLAFLGENLPDWDKSELATYLDTQGAGTGIIRFYVSPIFQFSDGLWDAWGVGWGKRYSCEPSNVSCFSNEPIK